MTHGRVLTAERVQDAQAHAVPVCQDRMLAESLRAVVSQRLVVRADGRGRIPALEVLYVNQAVGNLIRENRAFQIKSVLQTGKSQGMCSMETSLEELVAQGVITKEEAARHAEDPKKFS